MPGWRNWQTYQARCRVDGKWVCIGTETADFNAAEAFVRRWYRYYHVRLTNGAKWPKATQTQVYLLRVEAPGPDAVPQVRWSGDIPIGWRWATIHPLQRTVGPEAECDLTKRQVVTA